MNWLQKLAQEGLIVYHGSMTGDLQHLESNAPPYKGGIGTGVYTDFSEETALFYGEHVYKLQLRFGWDQILDLGPDHHWPVEGNEGHSILVGEHIPPFSFHVGEQLYTVGNEYVQNRLETELFGMSLNEYDELENLPIVLPDDYDGLEGLDLEELQLDERQLSLIQQLVQHSKAQAAQQIGELIDLDDIGAIAEAAGYKAVYLSGVRYGSSVNSELLVFDPGDMIFLGRIQ